MRKGWYPIYISVIIAALLVTFGTDKALSVMSENQPFVHTKRIVLDAGHGEPDGGATSCTGILESALNLQIALRLEDLFHLLGYETIQIRRTEISVYTTGETIAQKKISDLKERVRIVNEAPGCILISIHQNTYSDSRYSGPQVFYAATNGSEALAYELQNALTSSLAPSSVRKIKKGTGIYLLEHIQNTGVLVECGFISNPSEEAKLRSPDYQKKLCCVIASTVACHISNA